MAAYAVANYRITNSEAYMDYPPAVVKTLLDHGAEILAADYDSEILEGAVSKVTIILKFQSKEAVRNWYNSPEYQEIIHYRTDNSEGFVLIADEYESS